ncbi:MAG: ABC transporter permease [Pseudomonadota bacterium]
MSAYILRRLLLMIPTLLGITIVVFSVMAAAPGGISGQSLIDGQDMEPQVREALENYYNKLYGLDDPPPVQYLRWLNNASPIGFTSDETGAITGFSLFKGMDLGRSFIYGRPVLELLWERLPITLLLNVIALPLIYVLAISIGVRAAVERGKPFDTISGMVLLALWSMPTMLVGVLLIGFFASDQHWLWFPTGGLSKRGAIDMAFMPHWASVLDVLIMFGTSIAATLAALWLAKQPNKQIRTICFGIIGLILGWLMGDASSSSNLWLSVAFAALVGGLFVSIAQASYDSLRVGVMGLIGVFIGILIGASLGQGEFIRGFMLDRLWHLALPIICLTYGGFAALSKLTRTAVLENLLADYTRTARAKGASEQQLLWRHVFRNSLLPLITVAAGLLPSLLAGSVIVESIFSIDGMGKLAVEAVRNRDREMVLSITLLSGLLSLIGYLLADICYAIADPRVSYE